MLQREDFVDDIRKGLAVLQTYIRAGGTMNLTDTNVHAEDFVAGLLNVIFGWSLVSANQSIANYPCIDLIDETLGLAVQVTSEKGSDKLTDTIECLNRHALAGPVRQLKVFSLIPKQGRYTVNVACPGIEFEWSNDVLDFDDAVRAANGISDLRHLQRVHQYVVDAIPSVFAIRNDREPPLIIPETDPSSAWLAFSSRATRLIGRDTEQARLSAFLNSGMSLSWWLVTGTAGSGKSRLALELCRQVDSEWNAGFLSRGVEDFNWRQFRPSRKTLIVIDYVASRAAELSNILLTLHRASSSFMKPVRILLVERNESWWWATFSRDDSQSESAEIAACQYDEPLRLEGLSPDAILQLAEDVVRARNATWNTSIAVEFLRQLHEHDPSGRPLFAMIVARYLEAVEASGGESNLLRSVLNKEAARRRTLIQEPDKLRRMENLLLLATLVSGLLPREHGFRHLTASDVADLLPDVGLLDEELYNDIAGSSGGTTSLAGLQPDILGERFLLDRLSQTGVAGANAQRLLLAAWSIQTKDFTVVAVRTAFDFPGDPVLQRFFDVPIASSEARVQWAEMIAALVAQPDASDSLFAIDQLRKLTSLANSHRQDRKLQEAAARADYNVGVSTMLLRKEGAADLFDAAITRAGNDSLLGIMAILNRGILYSDGGEEEKAIQAWTTVIESRKGTDEMRACALNNRANVYARRADHHSAIRDRTAVIALKETSPDRRFVALFGRSESYCAIHDLKAALGDLNGILDAVDITPHDKLRAKLERAVVLHLLGRRDKARADLEALVASRLLFDGKSEQADALVKMAEQARRVGDYIKADGYLTQALAKTEAQGETNIRLLVVATMLVEDRGGEPADEVRKMWECLSNAVRKSANRMRVARARSDWFSE